MYDEREVAQLTVETLIDLGQTRLRPGGDAVIAVDLSGAIALHEIMAEWWTIVLVEHVELRITFERFVFFSNGWIEPFRSQQGSARVSVEEDDGVGRLQAGLREIGAEAAWSGRDGGMFGLRLEERGEPAAPRVADQDHILVAVLAKERDSRSDVEDAALQQQRTVISYVPSAHPHRRGTGARSAFQQVMTEEVRCRV